MFHICFTDVKSKNVLLDLEFEPKLTDFSLDRILGEITRSSPTRRRQSSPLLTKDEIDCVYSSPNSPRRSSPSSIGGAYLDHQIVRCELPSNCRQSPSPARHEISLNKIRGYGFEEVSVPLHNPIASVSFSGIYIDLTKNQN
ncbi:hypothetical protein L1887_40171 [Cichorium endivia]|nr:hypothetical protein L1887_40171 [Cichorium endivia]